MKFIAVQAARMSPTKTQVPAETFRRGPIEVKYVIPRKLSADLRSVSRLTIPITITATVQPKMAP